MNKRPYPYKRNCNECHKYYEGYGLYFCSKRCRSDNIEFKNKLRIGSTGHITSEETKNKLKLPPKNGYPRYWLGKKPTLEHRQKVGRKGELSVNWEGGLRTVLCIQCKKEIKVIKCRAESKKVICCSHRCQGIYYFNRKNKKNTDIERIFEQALIKRNIPYERQVPFKNRTIPDFIVNGKMIYCDGDYWHSLDKIKEKDIKVNKFLKDNGYSYLRFWGRDIKNNVNQCIDKIYG
jgi:DNA mismatch endonuclease (patch repair protein)